MAKLKWKYRNGWYRSRETKGLCEGFYSIQKKGIKNGILHVWSGTRTPIIKISTCKKVAQLIHNG